jgi:hypothetical protein
MPVSGQPCVGRHRSTAVDQFLGGLLFLTTNNSGGNRQVNALYPRFQKDEHFRDYIPFYEYFDGDSGRGVGASHQTGLTEIVAKLLQPRQGYSLPDALQRENEGSTTK